MWNSTSQLPTALDLTVTEAEPIDVDLNYPHKISDRGYTFVAVLLSIVCVLGTTFNIASLIVFASSRKLRSPTNVFIMSLNLCDLCMSCFGTFMPMSSSWSKKWMYGHTGCVLEGFVVFFLGLTSLYLLTAISVDRYLVITRPLLGSKITHEVAAVAVGLCWFGGFLWAAPPLFGWNRYALEGAGVSCSVVWERADANHSSYIFAIFVCGFIIPLTIIVFSYHGVYKTIRTMSRNKHWGINSCITKRNMKMEKKMAKTIAMMIMGFLGCWLPYATFSLIVVFQGSQTVSHELATYPAVFAKAQGVFNPLLYLTSNRQFRQASLAVLPCMSFRNPVQEKPDMVQWDDGREAVADDKDVGQETGWDTYHRDCTDTLVSPVLKVTGLNENKTLAEYCFISSVDRATVWATEPREAEGTEIIEMQESVPGPFHRKL